MHFMKTFWRVRTKPMSVDGLVQDNLIGDGAVVYWGLFLGLLTQDCGRVSQQHDTKPA